MKKSLIITVAIVCAVIGIIVGALSAVPAVNDSAAEKLAEELSALTPPEGTVVLESVSAAGNLTGNGNKMQYFAAILVTSGLSAEDLADHYRSLTGNSSLNVKAQTENAIPQSDRGGLSFKSTLEDGKAYYIVYMWDTSDSFYRNLDIRAH